MDSREPRAFAGNDTRSLHNDANRLAAGMERPRNPAQPETASTTGVIVQLRSCGSRNSAAMPDVW